MAGVFTGVLTDKWGWESAFWFWIISAFISSSILFGLWKYKPEAGKYL
jgi:sugar phosphate permease